MACVSRRNCTCRTKASVTPNITMSTQAGGSHPATPGWWMACTPESQAATVRATLAAETARTTRVRLSTVAAATLLPFHGTGRPAPRRGGPAGEEPSAPDGVRPALAGPALAGPALAGPGAGRPAAGGPALAGPAAVRPALAGPVGTRPGGISPCRARPALARPGGAGPEPGVPGPPGPRRALARDGRPDGGPPGRGHDVLLAAQVGDSVVDEVRAPREVQGPRAVSVRGGGLVAAAQRIRQ